MPSSRYSSTQQILHWVTVGLMLTILPLGWVVISLPEDSAIFYFWLYIHEGVGLSIVSITIFRIGWRMWDRPPALPQSVRKWARRAAHFVGGSLLAIMIVMPVSGYLWSQGHGHDVEPFNLFTMPRIAFGITRVGDFGKFIHQWGQWFVYSLISLHLLGVGYHVIVARDGVLARMLPPGALDPPREDTATAHNGNGAGMTRPHDEV